MAMNWIDRAMAATRGTQLGAIIACALKRDIPAPCFRGHASATSDGFVMCDFVDRNGDQHMGAFVGAAADLQRNAIGLAEHLKLNAAEREQFCKALADWFGSDYGGVVHRLRVALIEEK